MVLTLLQSRPHLSTLLLASAPQSLAPIQPLSPHRASLHVLLRRPYPDCVLTAASQEGADFVVSTFAKEAPMAKDKPEYEYAIELMGFNARNLELAAEAIYEKLGDLPLAGPKTMVLKFGGGQQLADRMVEIEKRLRENRGAEIKITSKRVKPIEENPNVSFWDPDQQAKWEAEVREEQERRRLAAQAAGLGRPRRGDVTMDGNIMTFHNGTLGQAAQQLRGVAGGEEPDTLSDDDLDGDFEEMVQRRAA